MAEMAESGTGKRLFVRQSSGLVRDVSVTNALFFNIAAFVGVGLTLYPAFYSLAFVPVWRFGPFSEYGWAAIITGIFCVILALIFASLTSVMPRSGGDYVFTTRIVGPFLGWLESWTLVIASIAIMAFEVPLVLRNIQITGRIIGIGAGGHFFKNANNWFTNSSGEITGWNGLIWSLVVLAVILGIVLLPTRRFHKVVTIMAGIGVASFVLMFVFGLLATHPSDFQHNLPKYTNGVTADQIAKSGSAILPGHTNDFLGDLFSRTVFPFMLGIVFLQFIGFQYSAYISGEVRGNVKRGISIALLGALLVGVIANSIYVDLFSNHIGFNTTTAWGYNYWGGVTNIALPLGQPPSMPLVAVIANKTLWPLWALISLAGAMFPLLLCPVYVNFISRMGLAWSLDRQLPEWFGEVNERMAAPLNAILATIGLCALFLWWQNFAVLPKSIAPPDGKLNLVATLWFSIFMAALTWIMPGVNAILIRFRRPDLIRNAPYKRWLWLLGIGWLVFPLWIYWFAAVKPIYDNLTNSGSGRLDYLNNSGITGSLVFTAAGLVIWGIMKIVQRSKGVDTSMLFAEIPPD
ncbi:MAG TPA: APC family permease [Gaiellales bacterium]|jgi:amino acid transporter|nr:APC family permease [Gaiellales bacterium]